MAEFTGKLEGFAAGVIGSPRRVLLDATAGDIWAGGNGAGGDIRVVNAGNKVTIRIDGLGAEPSPQAEAMSAPLMLRGDGSIRAGSSDTDGKLTLFDKSGREIVTLAAATQDLILRTPDGQMSAALRASEDTIAGLWLGNGGRNGLVLLRDRAGRNRASLDGSVGRLHLFDGEGNATVELQAADGDVAGLRLGGGGQNGHVTVRRGDGTNQVTLDGEDSQVRLATANGDVTITLDGHAGAGRFGGRGVNGDILVFSQHVDDRDPDNAGIWLQGSSGDIILRNADCAEEFDVRLDDAVVPGAVLVLEEDGRLAASTKEYDSRVAGIVSGADGVRPGIVLGRVPGARNRWPIALAGKVMCNVDASSGPIGVGTLLTTSSRPGTAMAATDRGRAFGAVIGKAMAPLACGIGRIPVLVALQ